MHFYRYTFIVVVLFLSSCSVRKASEPVKQPVAVHKTDTTKVTTVPELIKEKGPDTLVIGLLLPLQLETHFTEDTLPDTNPLIIPEAVPALHFYEGALAAVDSCADLKLFIQLRVIDCSGDSIQLSKIITGKQLNGCHVILAMPGSNVNPAVTTASRKLNIPIVLVQNGNRQSLENNKNVWILNPANNTLLKGMSSFLYKNFTTSNFITVYRDQRKEKELATFFSDEIDSLAGKPGTCINVNYQTGTWKALEAKLSKQKRNVLIVPTSDESYLSSLMSKLDEVQSDYTFLLCGLPSWDKFESINPAVLAELNTYIFIGLYIDQDQARVSSFRHAFISEYHADPLIQAYEAYDLVSFFAANYIKYKVDYSKYTGIPNLEFPESGFQFTPVCDFCGLENKNMTILKYGNFELKRVVPSK